MASHVWRPLKVEGRWNPVLRRQAANASGAYAVRDSKTHQVLYVGESSTGALWKTFQRHFQDWSALPEHYYDRRGRKRQRGEEFTNKHPERLEGCFEVTSRGKRTKERADEKAMAAQARWIASMHPSWNRDDGLADDGATAREVRAAQDAQEPEDAWGGLLNPRNAAAFVKEAAALPEDLELSEFESGWAITSAKWSAGDFLRLHPMMFGSRGSARAFGEWLVDALRTVRTDARVHRKESALLAAPPKPPHWRDVVFEAVPLGTSGKTWQVVARGYDREADARDISMVLSTERPRMANMVVAVAELGELRAAEFRADVARSQAVQAEQSARAERKASGLPPLPEPKTKAPPKKRAPRKPKAAKSTPKPEGYGEVETTGKHAGQTRLFNPRRFRVPIPAGKLVELGRMTELEVEQAPDRKIHVMRWAYDRAPILAYDARGRLFVVYGAQASGKATAEEDAEYKLSHWGKSPHGKVYSATIAERPLVLVGVSTRIVYTTKKGRDVELTDYVHAWGEGAPMGTKVEAPRVYEHRCQARAGCKENRALCIVGGSYRVTPDGIVG